jgi:hypothetical protein
MKRKSEAAEQAQEENKRRKEAESASSSWGAKADADSPTAMAVDDSLYDESSELTVTVTPTDFYSSLPGRRSFGGCNAYIEKEYDRFIDLAKFDRAVEKATTNTVSDEEMLQRYESLIGLPRGPNQGKIPNRISGGNRGKSGRRDNNSKSKTKNSRKSI